ncbi:MAG: extracellular solute-binding protein [Deltaproteobacteria bacterium]|nr:extracellular solute-binding protein [Deltaproteobacteria bacterium]
MKATLFFILSILWVVITSPSLAGAQKQITFWTTEVEKDRLEIQRDIAQGFTRKTGIGVRVIPVQENLLAERVTAAYAARSLPDVLFHPIDFTIGWAEAGILDYRSATQVVNQLGSETFGKGPLNLVRVSGGYAAVPVDGWGQLLVYRKDLFAKKGLPVPDRWDRILKAAQTLHNPPLIWGFEVATDPGETYTQQVFEHFALSNGVALTDKSGNIDIDTSEMVQTLEFYKSLRRFSPPGNLYWLHTRMDYLSGRAAMIIWSPFILDELSGLRRDQPVVPDIVKGESGFLAKNTGFVTVIQGQKGSAQYGQINYLGITQDADKVLAKQWVAFLLNEGYLRWLGMAAEGKLPVRKGTKDAPNRFIDGWKELEFGVTTRAKISGFYGMDVVKSIVAGVDGFDRWGFAEGKGALVSKIYGTKVVTKILKRFLDGELSAKDAARMMDERVRGLNTEN